MSSTKSRLLAGVSTKVDSNTAPSLQLSLLLKLQDADGKIEATRFIISLSENDNCFF